MPLPIDSLQFGIQIKESNNFLKSSRVAVSPDEKADCWAIIERSIHGVVVESSSSEKNSDLFTLWTAVRQRKQAIPWEEMANLEDTLIGNCTMTRFEVNRHMELIVKDLIVGNQRQVSDLAGMLSDCAKLASSIKGSILN